MPIDFEKSKRRVLEADADAMFDELKAQIDSLPGNAPTTRAMRKVGELLELLLARVAEPDPAEARDPNDPPL